MKSPFKKKKKKTIAISSNLQLILFRFHSAFTLIKFLPTHLLTKNPKEYSQSRRQNQGKCRKENLKSNSRSNFSIREVLNGQITLDNWNFPYCSRRLLWKSRRGKSLWWTSTYPIYVTRVHGDTLDSSFNGIKD